MLGRFPVSCMIFLLRKLCIIFILPLTFNLERAQQGKPAIMWEPDLGSHIAYHAAPR